MRLILPLRGLGGYVVLIGAAPVLAALAAGSWSHSPLLGLVLGISAAAVTAVVGLGHVRAGRLAAELCVSAEGAPRSLLDALGQIKGRLSDFSLRMANRHPVTGLPTREHLFQAINSQIEAVCGRGLLAILRLTDFDRLAAFDQAAADAALCELARRLKNGLSAERTIAQVDRDCIAIWFGCDPVAARREAQSIAYVASQVLEHADGILTPTLELGTAVHPADGVDASQLLLRATAALAKTEATGAGQARPHPAQPLTAIRETFTLEQDLAHAIALDQLTLEYQPVVDLAAGRMVGAEALLRWTHPTLGKVSPARFIPIVESIGLSDHYGLWVLNTASVKPRAGARRGAICGWR